MVEGFAGETSGESGRELIDRAERRSGDVGVERIEDPTSLRQQIHGAVSSVRRELCSTLPAGPYRPSVLRSSWEDDVGLLRSGIAGMVIYQADAVRTPEILRYLTEFSTAGAHIRVARRVTHRMMIVDRRLVFVAVDPDTLKPPYLLIREPALVRSFCSQFASTWKVAHTVGIGPEDSLADESVREILQILSSGVTDDAAARELGVSDRTIRRRVAAVLDLLGASSRFEAGVKATQAGWQEPAGPRLRPVQSSPSTQEKQSGVATAGAVTTATSSGSDDAESIAMSASALGVEELAAGPSALGSASTAAVPVASNPAATTTAMHAMRATTEENMSGSVHRFGVARKRLAR